MRTGMYMPCTHVEVRRHFRELALGYLPPCLYRTVPCSCHTMCPRLAGHQASDGPSHHGLLGVLGLQIHATPSSIFTWVLGRLACQVLLYAEPFSQPTFLALVHRFSFTHRDIWLSGIYTNNLLINDSESFCDILSCITWFSDWCFRGLHRCLLGLPGRRAMPRLWINLINLLLFLCIWMFCLHVYV